jgi:hypothetical protein
MSAGVTSMTKVSAAIRSLTESVIGGAPFAIGDRVTHPSGRTVEITGGQYWGTYGLSNFWYWREVMPDGSLSEIEEHGYGWSDSPTKGAA